MKTEKIHIIGGAGSGKTTLAAQLADRLGYPCHDLDRIGWRDHQKVPLDARLKAVSQILSQPQWITEGIFLWWTEALFKQADLIIWLDLPFPVSGWRIIKRYVIASRRGNNPYPGMINLYQFLLGVGGAHYRKHPLMPESPDDDLAVTGVGMIQVLSNYPEKVIRCRQQRDFDEVLKTLAG